MYRILEPFWAVSWINILQPLAFHGRLPAGACSDLGPIGYIFATVLQHSQLH